jgi:hypothetical protein
MLLIGSFLAGTFATPAWAQEAGLSATMAPRGVPHDWSHRHLIFSKPPASGALNQPPPRYSMQQAWRKRQLTVTENDALDARGRQMGHSWFRPSRGNQEPLHRDWAMSMGTSATVGEDMYPAKYSFSTSTANCGNAATPDFVVYNTGPAGAATGVVTFESAADVGDTVTIGSNTYTFENTCTTSSPTNCVETGSSTANASTANLQAAVMAEPNLCNGGSGLTCYSNVSAPNPSVTATSSRPLTGTTFITLTAITTGTGGNSVALSTTAASSRITVSGSTLSGGANQLATVAAYDNLYSGCSGTVPEVYWQYNTGYAHNSTTWDNSVASTSVVLSLDGSQVAFVQNASGIASLIILKWASNSSLVQMDTGSTNVSAASYHGCTAPCMTRLTFSNSANDGHSSPFYDYDSDALYVGDDSGALHKFTGVFGSVTPAEAFSSWPIMVSSGEALTGPVYDTNTGSSTGSGNIYVGDSIGNLWFVRETGSTVGACTASGTPPCLGENDVAVGDGSTRPLDAPIVDSSSEHVYAFTGCRGAVANCGTATDSAEVVQSPVALGTGTVVTDNLGISSRESNTFDGDFDNNYYSGDYSNGHLYACGNLIGAEARILYQLSFTAAGQLNTTVVTGPALGLDATSDCSSSITEIFNGTTDRIFMSIPSAGLPTGCAGTGCLMSFVVTAWTAGTSYAAATEILDSNGGIEKVTTAGTSGTTQPTWPTTVGNTVADHTVTWTYEGPFLGTTSAWAASTKYAVNAVILDSNFNLEKVTAITGNDDSGSTEPTWPTTVGGTVVDHNVTWTNEGPGNSNLAVSGGGSGVIIDNTVPLGTLSGASQVYFSPLLNGTCGASSGVGCAIQASQQGLQ